jgi:hypothetical protein
MHIISKFKDYYDSVAGQKGIDKTIVFERWEQKLSVSVRSKGIKQWWNPSNFPTYGSMSTKAAGHKHFSLFIVGFCGKIYIGAKVTSTIQHKYAYNDVDSVVSYIYGIDYIKEKVCEYYNNEKYFNGRRDANLEHIMSFTTDKKMLELFYTYKTPQFILWPGEQDNLVINGCLKDIQFYKMFDPFRAFQEIEMYITGVLGINNKPMVEISDKHKIVGHGFDPKYSFRKEPEDKNKKK